MPSTDVQCGPNFPHITTNLQMEYLHLLLFITKMKKKIYIFLYKIEKKSNFLHLIQAFTSLSMHMDMVKLILTNFEPIWILQVWNCDHTCYINTLRRKAVYMWEKNQMHIWGENGTSWKRLERNKGEKTPIFCVYALKYLIQILSYLDHLFLLVQQLWIDHKVAQKTLKNDWIALLEEILQWRLLI